MRKWLILFICLIAGTALAGQLKVLSPFIPTSTCTTSNDSQQWAPFTLDSDASSNSDYKAVRVVLSETKTFTMYKVRSCDQGSDTGNLRVSIVNGNSTEPDETDEIPNSAVTKNASDLTDCTSYGYDEYVLSTPFTLSAGTYWLLIKEENSADILVRYAWGSTGDRRCWSDDSGVNWSCNDDDALNAEIWGCN